MFKLFVVPHAHDANETSALKSCIVYGHNRNIRTYAPGKYALHTQFFM